MAGTGATLSLNAIGMQDTMLTDLDPKDYKGSFFNYRPVKCTNATICYRSHKKYPDGSDMWPFGQDIRFQLSPKNSGDLLANAFLKCTLPALTGNDAYCYQVGQAMINELKFIVDDTTLETIPGDWLFIHDELYATDTENYAMRYLSNDGRRRDLLPDATSTVDVYVPLPFLFSRTRTRMPGSWEYNVTTDIGDEADIQFKPYFYLCAATNQKVTIEVSMNPVTFFSNATTSVSLSEMSLITEEIVLTEEERNFYMNNRQVIIANTVTRQPTLRLDKSQGVKNSNVAIPPGCNPTFRNFLTVNTPVKAFHFFIRNQDFENSADSTEFLNRYNFSTNVTSSNIFTETLNQSLSDAHIYINGNKQLGFMGTSNAGSNYYKFVQPFQHNLRVPDRNIYTYSFALNPKDPNPTGSLDFSLLTSSKTTLNGDMRAGSTSNAYNLHMYYLGYKVIGFDKGYSRLLFA